MIQLIEAALVGAFAAITVLYTFQTKVPYPMWLVQSYEHPWVFLILALITIFIGKVSPRIAVMLLLLILAVWMDGILFVRDPEDVSKQKSGEQKVQPHPQEVWPFDVPTSIRRSDLTAPALRNVPIVEPVYPTFQTPDDIEIASGPAPFLS